jgi:hypothetical protein
LIGSHVVRSGKFEGVKLADVPVANLEWLVFRDFLGVGDRRAARDYWRFLRSLRHRRRSPDRRLQLGTVGATAGALARTAGDSTASGEGRVDSRQPLSRVA